MKALARVVAGILATTCLLVPASVSASVPPQTFSLVGDATQPGTAIHLTPATFAQTGAAWYLRRELISQGFTATFRFRIAHRVNTGADGLAFVIQNDSSTAIGGVGYGMGYGKGDPFLGGPVAGIPDSLAVEFDTWKNTGQFVVQDPNANHISVHTLGLSQNSADESASIGSTGTTKLPPFADATTHSVTIAYAPGTLNVYLDGQLRLTVLVHIATRLALPDGKAWVGFTASTGAAAETHNILYFSYSAS